MIGWLAGAAVGVSLLVAGGAKLRDPAWPSQARGLGAPAVVIPVLPWVELVLGALLVVHVALPWTAWAAVALLVLFTVLVVARLVQGRRVPCACFGRLSAAPIGPGTIVRNAVLVALAVLAAVAA
ncbi:MAG: hypothetical protein IPM45_13920 [Acidimicrobiales bacterium]|nr:hypothetical protein [Acidimicrobiales bacterium]